MSVNNIFFQRQDIGLGLFVLMQITFVFESVVTRFKLNSCKFKPFQSNGVQGSKYKVSFDCLPSCGYQDFY